MSKPELGDRVKATNSLTDRASEGTVILLMSSSFVIWTGKEYSTANYKSEWEKLDE